MDPLAHMDNDDAESMIAALDKALAERGITLPDHDPEERRYTLDINSWERELLTMMLEDVLAEWSDPDDLDVAAGLLAQVRMLGM